MRKFSSSWKGALLSAAVIAGLAAPAEAQVRQRGQEFRDLQGLLQIIRAFLDGENIDLPAQLAAFNQLYGRNDPFSLFDRDRSGGFSADGGATDLDLAILQFNHDIVDFDQDGVLGFIELECEYAAGGLPLQPDDSTSDGITPDGLRDCDADLMTNEFEIEGGLDPLDGTDGNEDPDQDNLTNTQEFRAGTSPNRADSDNDGVNDDIEVGANPLQPINTDGQPPIDALDTDSDNDGTLDNTDNCRVVVNADQANADQDAQGDACDPDDEK